MNRRISGTLVLVVVALASGSVWVDRQAGRMTIDQEAVVLRAEPTSVVSSGPAGTGRKELDVNARYESRVLIVKRGRRYFWASREDRELTRVRSGFFTHFIDLRGGGYVKVLDQRELSEPLYSGASVQYFEHVSMGMGTLTYWGQARRFDP